MLYSALDERHYLADTESKAPEPTKDIDNDETAEKAEGMLLCREPATNMKSRLVDENNSTMGEETSKENASEVVSMNETEGKK